MLQPLQVRSLIHSVKATEDESAGQSPIPVRRRKLDNVDNLVNSRRIIFGRTFQLRICIRQYTPSTESYMRFYYAIQSPCCNKSTKCAVIFALPLHHTVFLRIDGPWHAGLTYRLVTITRTTAHAAIPAEFWGVLKLGSGSPRAGRGRR